MRLLPILLSTICLLCSFCSPTIAVLAPDPNVPPAIVIWYIPHPDDETIAMAGAIQASYAAGNRNIFVYLTRGGNSLAGYLQCPHPNLVKTARMQEATTALLLLGAQEDDIIFFDFKDGNVSLETTLAIMRAFRDQYPTAAHRTVSYFDQHNDHKNVALALFRLQQESIDLDVAYYQVSVYNLPPERRAKGRVICEPVPDLALKQQAIAVYTNLDPDAGYYAVGGRSVPNLLNAAANDIYEYRDNGPNNFRFKPLFLAIRAKSVSAAMEYVTSSDWCYITRMDIGQDSGLALRVQKGMMALPGHIVIYTGSEHHMNLTRSPHSSLFAGMNVMNLVTLEYRFNLVKKAEHKFIIEIRWYSR